MPGWGLIGGSSGAHRGGAHRGLIAAILDRGAFLRLPEGGLNGGSSLIGGSRGRLIGGSSLSRGGVIGGSSPPSSIGVLFWGTQGRCSSEAHRCPGWGLIGQTFGGSSEALLGFSKACGTKVENSKINTLKGAQVGHRGAAFPRWVDGNPKPEFPQGRGTFWKTLWVLVCVGMLDGQAGCVMIGFGEVFIMSQTSNHSILGPMCANRKDNGNPHVRSATPKESPLGNVYSP